MWWAKTGGQGKVQLFETPSVAILGHDRCIPRAGPYAELSIYWKKSTYQHPKAHTRGSQGILKISMQKYHFFSCGKTLCKLSKSRNFHFQGEIRAHKGIFENLKFWYVPYVLKICAPECPFTLVETFLEKIIYRFSLNFSTAFSTENPWTGSVLLWF